jgi:hypothetical protein
MGRPQAPGQPGEAAWVGRVRLSMATNCLLVKGELGKVRARGRAARAGARRRRRTAHVLLQGGEDAPLQGGADAPPSVLSTP